MAAATSWYLKREAGVAGPFTTAQIRRDIVLGRIDDSASLSSDRIDWYSPGELDAFSDVRPAPVGSDAFARHDERQSERRGSEDAQRAPARDGRGKRDRRRDEAAAVRARRANSGRVWRSLAEPRPRAVMAWLIIAGASAVALYLAVNLTPRAPKLADCNVGPGPKVNWASCQRARSDLRQADLRGAVLKNTDLSASDLAGANLVGSDLAYADLSTTDFTLANLEFARLVGANLRGADLRHANLQAADLQHADLRNASVDGADLAGADLSHAIWIGGRTCRSGSVGTCLAP